LHSHSIAHGDIKSQNILIGSDGRAKIADFGAAVPRGGTQDEKSGPLSGTPAFMAPEVARGEERGLAADIWALGCTVIEMATGKGPWHGILKDQDVLAAVYRIGFCSDSTPPVPNWLSDEGKDFLLNCLKRDPTERWSAEKLLDHPFVRSCDAGLKTDGSSISTFSPQSALEFGVVFEDSETEDDEEEAGSNAAERIREFAGIGFMSSSSDWDRNEEGWIEVRSSNITNVREIRECENTDHQVQYFDFADDNDFLLSHLNLNLSDFLYRTSEQEDCFLQSNYDFDVCEENLTNKVANSSSDQTIYVLSVSSWLLLLLRNPSCLLQNSSLVVKHN
jgi:serine/threonine protein kinase